MVSLCHSRTRRLAKSGSMWQWTGRHSRASRLVLRQRGARTTCAPSSIASLPAWCLPSQSRGAWFTTVLGLVISWFCYLRRSADGRLFQEKRKREQSRSWSTHPTATRAHSRVQLPLSSQNNNATNITIVMVSSPPKDHNISS